MRKTLITAAILATVAFGGSACDTGTSDSRVSAKAVDGKSPKDTKATKAPEKDPMAGFTNAQKQAVGSALDYLDTSAFSKQGLIDQLSSKFGDQFPKAVAIFAVNHLKVSWNGQAVKAAKEYLDTSHFSRAGLIDQLSSPYGGQFTKAQAIYGVNHSGL